MRKIIVIAVALIVCSYVLNAQNESGTRNVYKYGAQRTGNWYDSKTAMFQIKYPIIRSIPPLSVSMPYDILLSYVYLDSLMRFSKQKQTDSLINSWTSLNDTLKYAIKYLYKLRDYNPVIFTQYGDEISRYRKSFGRKSKIVYNDGFTIPNDSSSAIPYYGKYTNTTWGMILHLNEKFAHVIPDTTERAALFALSESECIYRVRILSTPDSMYYKHGQIDSNSTRYIVTAEVLDTIKGKVFNNYNIPETNANNKNTNDITAANTMITNPIIKIQYSSLAYDLIGDDDNSMEILYEKPDSLFLRSYNRPYIFKLSPNQECIVFLEHEGHLIDSTYDYYDFIISPRAGVALPIINGQVRDVNHIWSNVTYTPYVIWRDRINYFINKILNCNY